MLAFIWKRSVAQSKGEIEIGNKLIAMAQDFPEDKYDFRLQKDQRTFAENLLHVGARRRRLRSSRMDESGQSRLIAQKRSV